MTDMILALVHGLLARASHLDDEAGFSTAELLANAALAIGALVAIWGAMNLMGVNIIESIGARLSGVI